MKGAQIKVQAIFPNVSSHGIVTHRSHVNILKTEQYHSFPISGREEIEILPNTNINWMEQKAANPFAWKCKREKKNQINTKTGNWLNEKRKKQKKKAQGYWLASICHARPLKKSIDISLLSRFFE